MFSSRGLSEWYKEKGFDCSKELFAFVDEEGQQEDTLSFQQLHVEASWLSYLLLSERKYGLKEGDVVLLMFQPGKLFMKSLLACIYAGLIAVPLAPPPPSQIEKVLCLLTAILCWICILISAENKQFNWNYRRLNIQNMFVNTW
jgi:acyl-CoA synthetase (AMP-forming)/AMP-acid ligase II